MYIIFLAVGFIVIISIYNIFFRKGEFRNELNIVRKEKILLNKKNEVTYREKVADSIGRVRDVKISPDGFIYIGVENKGIFKLVPKKWD